jgi:hypothetical protein
LTSSAALASEFAPHPAVLSRVSSARGLVLSPEEYTCASAIACWDALSDQATEPNPFFESWYLLPSQRELDRSGQVRLFVLEQDGQWLGMTPVIANWKYYNRPIPHLASWLHPNCFHGAPLIRAGFEQAFFRALFGWADKASKAALFLHLAHMPLDGPVYAGLQTVLSEQRRTSGLVYREERVILRSELPSQGYIETALTGRKAKDVRRQRRNLAVLGQLESECLEGPQGLAEWIDEFLALEAAGWKGAAGSALACHADTDAMFRQSMHSAASRGQLERWALTLGGQRIAMLAVLLAANGAFAYKTTFDETHALNSPGALLHVDYLSVLDRRDRAWTDSCANTSHPMIRHIWRETRAVGRISVAIGGPLRRLAFSQIVKAELARNPNGVTA